MLHRCVVASVALLHLALLRAAWITSLVALSEIERLEDEIRSGVETHALVTDKARSIFRGVLIIM